MKKVKIMLYLYIVVIVTLCVYLGCNRVSDSNNHLVTYTGRGNDITNSFICLGGKVHFDCLYTGEGNFIVQLMDKNTGQMKAFLVNEIDNFSGRVSTSPKKGEYYLQAESNGEWMIKVSGDIKGNGNIFIGYSSLLEE